MRFMPQLLMQVPLQFSELLRDYTYFSFSNHQYEVLSSVKLMLKRLVTTLWSARYEAIRAMKTGFQRMIQALE